MRNKIKSRWSEIMLRKARQQCFDRDCDKMITWLKNRLHPFDGGLNDTGLDGCIICLTD